MNYSLVDNGVMIELHDETYEGWNGDFDPSDPDDELLLRFDVFKLHNNEWEPVDNASYCTQLPASLSVDKINIALSAIMREVAEPVRAGASIKKTCERMSWLSIKDLQ